MFKFIFWFYKICFSTFKSNIFRNTLYIIRKRLYDQKNVDPIAEILEKALNNKGYITKIYSDGYYPQGTYIEMYGSVDLNGNDLLGIDDLTMNDALSVGGNTTVGGYLTTDSYILSSGSVRSSTYVRADTAFKVGSSGTVGVTGTFEDKNGNTITVTGGIITSLS